MFTDSQFIHFCDLYVKNLEEAYNSLTDEAKSQDLNKQVAMVVFIGTYITVGALWRAEKGKYIKKHDQDFFNLFAEFIVNHYDDIKDYVERGGLPKEELEALH